MALLCIDKRSILFFVVYGHIRTSHVEDSEMNIISVKKRTTKFKKAYPVSLFMFPTIFQNRYEWKAVSDVFVYVIPL